MTGLWGNLTLNNFPGLINLGPKVNPIIKWFIKSLNHNSINQIYSPSWELGIK